MGKSKQFILGVVFLVVFGVFLVLAIALPVAFIVNPGYKLVCDSETNLNRGEQYECVIRDEYVWKTWVIDISSGNDRNYAKAYRTTKTLSKKSVSIKWEDFSITLKSKKYFAYAISAPAGILPSEFSGKCTGSACNDKVLAHFYSQTQFSNAFSDGTFIQKKSGVYCEFTNGVKQNWNMSVPSDASSNYFFYLILSNTGSSSVDISFSATFNYNNYITSSLTPLTLSSSGKYNIIDLSKSESIIIEYPCKESCTIDGDDKTPPRAITMQIHDINVNWSRVAACFVVFGLLAIVALIVAIRFCVKGVKKTAESSAKQTGTVVATAQPVAAAPVAAAPAAYPAGQPAAYPAAYPAGQPAAYPAGQPAAYPAGQPAYPGQYGADPAYAGAGPEAQPQPM